MRQPVGKLRPIYVLEDVLRWPPMFAVRTLKAPSDPAFAFAAIYSHVAGMDKSKEAVQK